MVGRLEFRCFGFARHDSFCSLERLVVRARLTWPRQPGPPQPENSTSTVILFGREVPAFAGTTVWAQHCEAIDQRRARAIATGGVWGEGRHTGLPLQIWGRWKTHGSAPTDMGTRKGPAYEPGARTGVRIGAGGRPGTEGTCRFVPHDGAVYGWRLSHHSTYCRQGFIGHD